MSRSKSISNASQKSSKSSVHEQKHDKPTARNLQAELDSIKGTLSSKTIEKEIQFTSADSASAPPPAAHNSSHLKNLSAAERSDEGQTVTASDGQLQKVSITTTTTTTSETVTIQASSISVQQPVEGVDEEWLAVEEELILKQKFDEEEERLRREEEELAREEEELQSQLYRSESFYSSTGSDSEQHPPGNEESKGKDDSDTEAMVSQTEDDDLQANNTNSQQPVNTTDS